MQRRFDWRFEMPGEPPMIAVAFLLTLALLSFAAWVVSLALVGVAMWRDGERMLGLVFAFPALALLAVALA